MTNTNPELNVAPLPGNEEAEKAALCCLLLDPATAIERLSPQAFLNPAHREIFLAIAALRAKGKRADLVLTTEHLHAAGRLADAGGPAYLAELLEYLPTTAGFSEYVAILREYQARRELLAAADRLAHQARHGDEPASAAAEVGSMLSEICKTEGAKPEFEWADGLAPVTEDRELIEGVLPTDALLVIYGTPGCGKSFLALDMAAAIASGQPFGQGGHGVLRGLVIYCALEGSNGVRNRIVALRRAGRLRNGDPLAMVFRPFSLLEPGEAGKLADAVADAISERPGHKPALIVIDTLARALAGGDENASGDMGLAIRTADCLRTKTGASVLLVHHSGKDATKGGRGHSSLKGATDCEIEITRPEGSDVATVTCTKSKDSERFAPMAFSLESITLCNDSRGRPVKTCVVRHEDPVMVSSGKPGRPRGVSCAELVMLLPQPTTGAWERAAKEETGISKTRFHDRKKEIEASGMAVRLPGNGGWVPKGSSSPEIVPK